jgi:hypothetical protein
MKKDQEINVSSRRDFIKKTSIVTIGTISLSNPVIGFFSSLMDKSQEKIMEMSLTCELYRFSDLLHLKYYFFNVDTNYASRFNKLKKVEDSLPIFIYIQLPSQHITEDLVESISGKNSRIDFDRMKSFLSNKSWLAFKVKEYKNGNKETVNTQIKLNAEDLLNWDHFFTLVTLDDFLPSGIQHLRFKEKLTQNECELYKKEIEKIISVFQKKHIPSDDRTIKYNNGLDLFPINNNTNSPKSPLTTFELPYKMMLSPISGAEKGRYIFRKNQVQHLLNDNGLSIVKPWQNNLKFKTFNGNEEAPRFKIVNYIGDSLKDNDENLNLLPAAIQRQELHKLTLFPNIQRDVVAKYLQFGVLGASTQLKYKHDNPLNQSIVAWDQIVNNARDNFISITYRAIDLFTGMKLLVSIVGERSYIDKVSFVRKRYYVTFAEREKKFDLQTSPKGTYETISRTPFKTIKALSKGSFFSPERLPINKVDNSVNKVDNCAIENNKKNEKVYAVLEENSKELLPENKDNYLSFEYIGIDKNGNEHVFSSKMSFIFANDYEITSLEKYCYNLNGEAEVCYSANGQKTVDIKHIGQLNPSVLVKKCDPKIDCCLGVDLGNHPTEDKYTFELVDNFKDSERREQLRFSIKDAKDFFMCDNRKDFFEQRLIGEVTFSKIDNLKNVEKDSENLKKGFINPNSSASTFKTDGLFLFSQLNVFHDQDNNQTNASYYLKDYPLIPDLLYANVIISQIDQIEGRNVMRKVRFADSYIMGNEELEELVDGNQSKLLFKLLNNESDFFKKNYRRSGGMVNPGIGISHISVLDNGITFNETHNIKNRNLSTFKTTADQKSIIPTSSVFGEIDAEILGISLRDIVDVVMDEVDLPTFKFIEDVEGAVNQFKKLEADYKDIFDDLQTDYNTAKTEYDRYKNLYENALLELEKLKGFNPINWIENLAEMQISYYANKIKVDINKKYIESGLKTKAENLVAEVVKDLKQTFNIDVVSILDSVISSFNINDISQANKVLLDLYKKLKSKLTEEGLTICLTILIESQKIDDNALLKLVKKLEEIVTIPDNVTNEILHIKSIIESIYNKSLSVQSEVENACNQLNKQIEEAKRSLPDYVIKELTKDNDSNFAFAVIELLMYGKSLYELLPSYERSLTELKTTNIKSLAIQYFNMHPNATKVKESLGIYKDQFKEPLEWGVEAIKKDVLVLKSNIVNISDQKNQEFTELKKELNEFLKMIEFIFISDSELISFGIKFPPTLVEQAEKINTKLTTLKSLINSEYTNAIAKVKQYEGEFKNAENLFKNFLKNEIKKIEDLIKVKEKELLNAINENLYINDIEQKINELKAIYKKLKEPISQELNYNYNYSNFRKATFAGVIDLIPKGSDTQLNIDVSYATKLQLDSFDGDSLKLTSSFHTKSSLTNFKLGFAGLIYIDFAKVGFVSGSDIKDDFDVKIRSVDFGGIMAFVDAFKDYLKSIDNNLVFDLNSERAQIGYGINIPDFSAGYFNFFNLNLSALLTLPFDPGKSLQLNFGFGNELNKFGITVSGIFGGQGYFNLIAEPKRGIVGLIIVLEFGAIFNMNITVAKGTAYLVGGVYIRQQKMANGREIVNLKAYVLAVGRLRIIGLFSASLTFYVGLEGDGDVIKGVATLTASKRFTKFFKISVSCQFSKVLRGGKKKGKASDKLNLFLHLCTPEVDITDDMARIIYNRFEFETKEGKNGDIHSLKIKQNNSNNLDQLGLMSGEVLIREKGTKDAKSQYKLTDAEIHQLEFYTPYFGDNLQGEKIYLPLTILNNDDRFKRKASIDDTVTAENYYESYF